ncbi:DUF805 domain-containing protein [Psychrobacter sp. 28M-43]|nr:DUF805 domain-containing protein [Psychrobacter sp. 28M-43]
MANNHNAEENYGIIDWFKKSMKNYTNLSGRARRKEFWYFVLVQIGLTVLAMILDKAVFGSESEFFNACVAFGMLVPSITVCVRRLHDTGRSGWWLLLAAVPLIGFIMLLVFFAIETNSKTNQWGPPAK